MKLKSSLFALLYGISAYSADYSTYFEKYGNAYDIPPQLLWGVAKHESGLDPLAVNKNTNGTYDLGLMQINSIHLPMLRKKGIQARDLFNPETSIAVGAYILSDCFNRYGHNWKGLTCYNGRIEGNDYALKVMSKIKQELSTHKNKEIERVALSN